MATLARDLVLVCAEMLNELSSPGCTALHRTTVRLRNDAVYCRVLYGYPFSVLRAPVATYCTAGVITRRAKILRKSTTPKTLRAASKATLVKRGLKKTRTCPSFRKGMHRSALASPRQIAPEKQANAVCSLRSKAQRWIELLHYQICHAPPR